MTFKAIIILIAIIIVTVSFEYYFTKKVNEEKRKVRELRKVEEENIDDSLNVEVNEFNESNDDEV
jgi:hypothetical protein